MKNLLTIVCGLMLLTTKAVVAANYTTFLTTSRGFTEVTSTSDIVADNSQCYILVPAETSDLIVGIGPYQDKPVWAGEDTKALRYKRVLSDPVLDLSNFFTIEADGQYIGLRNVVLNTSLFQTHDNAGYMYVLTYTEPTMSDWCYLIPTYQSGYWLFENGKYPISSGNWACGYMGPWNKQVKEGEPIALNRRNVTDDAAGHYRLFRISRSDLYQLRAQLLAAASASNPIDCTGVIINPSFEAGTEAGWTLTGKNPDGNDEFKTRDYGMSGKDGTYLMNAFQWWASSLGVNQVVENLPSGMYELSGVVATWEGRTVTFSGNEVTNTINGQGDGSGIPVSLTVTVGFNQKLKIAAGSTGQWWVGGHESETQTFFKLDDVKLNCTTIFLNGLAVPLPNDRTTTLAPDVWYYVDLDSPTDYWLIGNIDGMIYSTDGMKPLGSISIGNVARKMTLAKGRTYFKTTRTDATLQLKPGRTLTHGTFTAVALNVDGLPNSVLGITLNADGPGAEGTKKISSYLAAKNYDFIGCSEDFNYNGSLMESLSANYSCGTVRETLSASGLDLSMLINGFRFDTDGLNLIWKNSKTSATNESWVQWTSLAKTDGNQYVKKGFRHYDMQIDGGPVIDVYILHMDAGDTNATDSRHSQWQQLAEAINNADASRPKLIIGDTNSRWTREDITVNFMNRLAANLTASDVWVELFRDGIYPTTSMDDITDQSNPANYTNYEVVDKIIYINPKAANSVQLVPRSFRIEQDYTYGTVDGDDNTKALGDHSPVVVEFAYTMVGDVVNPELILSDAADNTTSINDFTGITANVVLDGRTLYKDGSWNTLCLPFNLDIAGSPLDGDGVTVKTLVSSSFADGTLTLNFTPDNITTIEAGRPYIIKWNDTSSVINSPVFAGVTIAGSDCTDAEGEAATMKGLYAPLAIAGEDPTMLYLSSDNNVYWPNAAMNINAFRAYFVLNGGLTAGDPADADVMIRNTVLDFDGTAPYTAIDGIVNGKSVNGKSIYNLNGQRMNTMQRGINIINGVKILIK